MYAAVEVPSSFEGSSPQGFGSLRRVLGNRAKHFGRSFCQAGKAERFSLSSRGSNEILRGAHPRTGRFVGCSREVEQLSKELGEQSLSEVRACSGCLGTGGR